MKDFVNTIYGAISALLYFFETGIAVITQNSILTIVSIFIVFTGLSGMSVKLGKILSYSGKKH